MCQASSILGLGHTGRLGLKKNTSQFKYSHSLLPPPQPRQSLRRVKTNIYWVCQKSDNKILRLQSRFSSCVVSLFCTKAGHFILQNWRDARKSAIWEDDEMEFGILQFGVNVWRDQLGLMFASYFGFFVWISRAMCGLDNTRQQHLHTCHRSIQQYNTGANSQPCQENRDLITPWERWESSHNAVARLFQWFYLSVIHLILVAPG